jgi:hypothetical protein
MYTDFITVTKLPSTGAFVGGASFAGCPSLRKDVFDAEIT